MIVIQSRKGEIMIFVPRFYKRHGRAGREINLTVSDVELLNKQEPNYIYHLMHIYLPLNISHASAKLSR